MNVSLCVLLKFLFLPGCTCLPCGLTVQAFPFNVLKLFSSTGLKMSVLTVPENWKE